MRIEYAGAVYHVMCRGDRREAIFKTDDDRRLMLETLGETCERSGFVVHGYVLMPNHYHILLVTPEPNLVAGMKWFQGTYTQRFNRRHGQSGHVFQGRYKAIPVQADEDDYFRRASEYIHLNPARAGMLNREKPRLVEFPWSSFPALAGKTQAPPWLKAGRVLAASGLPDESPGSRRRYAGWMQVRTEEVMSGGQGAGEREEGREFRRGWYLGNESFRDELLDRVDAAATGKKRRSFQGEELRTHDERAALKRLEEACAALQVSVEELWQRKQTDEVKQGVAWWVKSQSVVPDEWVSAKLEMRSRTNVHRAVSAFRKATDAKRKAIKRQVATMCGLTPFTPAGKKLLHVKALRVNESGVWENATGLCYDDWALVSDESTDKIRTVAHELLHMLGLKDTGPSGNNTENVMYYKSNTSKHFVGHFRVESVKTGTGTSYTPKHYEMQWNIIFR
ncbi:MAG: transposase [Kiritimatiellia bacterium]